MYASEDAKKEYFAKRYQFNKDMYKRNQNNYWENYAKRKLEKDEVTEEEIRQCKNAYYREYRQKNKKADNKIKENFWNNYAEQLNNQEGEENE